MQIKAVKYYILTLLFAFLVLTSFEQETRLSDQQKLALTYLDSFFSLPQSAHWQNISPSLLIKNIRKNITYPNNVYSGSNTNFCGYAALSFTCIKTYPLRYTKFLIELYSKGEASFRDVQFNPSYNVKQAAGLLKFKGALDINHADQLWFMTLADHFKGYLNIFNRDYRPGGEDKLWPATNFAKFNRMLRQICNYETHSVGTDLIRPYSNDIVSFLNEKLANNHQVFLFLNNAILHNSKHTKVKYRIPTHYVVLFGITTHDDMVIFDYWDYGFRTRREMPNSVFKDIVFGATWCKKQTEE